METLKKIKSLTSTLDSLSVLTETNEDDLVVLEHSQEATSYLLSHDWCSDISEGWLAISWGDILSLFLYRISSDYPEVDEFVWMVVGDIPPAYIDIESANQPDDVLRCYVDIMEDWVTAIELNNSVEECYPVEVPATKENASMLKSRLSLILEELNSSDYE